MLCSWATWATWATCSAANSATTATAAIGDHLELSAGRYLVSLGEHRTRQHRRANLSQGRLLVQQLLDPAQRAAQSLRIGSGPAQGQRGLKLGSDGIRDGLQRFRCISLRSAVLQCARCAID
jgi:hypothetical protein